MKSGHIAKKGTRWYPVVELRDQPAQRCGDCGRRFWRERKPHPACPACGGELRETRERRQRWLEGHKRREDAKFKLHEVLGDLTRGSYVQPSKQTVAEFLAEWFAAVEHTLSAPTFASYKAMIERYVLPRLGSVALRDLDGGHLNQLFAEMLDTPKQRGTGTLSRRTTRYAHAILHHALSDAVRWGRLARNPADVCDPPKAPKPADAQNTWTAEQAATFFASLREDRLGPVAILYLTTGARKGEILGLRWPEVDLDRGTIQIVRSRTSIGYTVVETPGKTRGSQRLIELDAPTVAALKAWRTRQLEERLAAGPVWADTGYVFTDELGRPLHPDAIDRMLRRRVKRAGLPPLSIKGYRHTWATMALEAGVNPKVVAERLGHSSIRVTMDVYSHARPGMQREAAEQVAGLLFPNG